MQALSSRAVDARSQGELQGAAQSVGSIAAIIGPPLYAGVFAKFTGAQSVAPIPAMPLMLAALFGLVALLLFRRGLRDLPSQS
mgnify:CR=1 FL=1